MARRTKRTRDVTTAPATVGTPTSVSPCQDAASVAGAVPSTPTRMTESPRTSACRTSSMGAPVRVLMNPAYWESRGAKCAKAMRRQPSYPACGVTPMAK
ncbi:MAG TPA: hypothetical protein VJR24_02520 [Gemmatimonadaceae bacterium]|nr:hypothetical protein [Gemmatimonadaceae bacterium]